MRHIRKLGAALLARLSMGASLHAQPFSFNRGGRPGSWVFLGLVLILPLPSAAQPACSTTGNFNGTPIAGGKHIWFSSVFSVPGLNPSQLTKPLTITFTRVTITFTANSTPYTVNVPNANITYDPSATTATTTFDGLDNQWFTTLPTTNLSGNNFLDAVEFQVPASGFPGGIQPVAWQGTFGSTTSGLSVQWQWGAAVYTQFSANYNSLGVKSVDDNKASQYKNSDHAGTPENFTAYVTGGATGGGGSNYTGSYSGTAACTAGVASQQLAYVTNFTSTSMPGTVSVINTANNTLAPPPNPITVGNGPIGIAITPDGTQAWVADQFSGSVSVIDLATNTVVRSISAVGVNPEGIAIAKVPSGNTLAYVTDFYCCLNGFGGNSFVNVINTATWAVNTLPNTPIAVGVNPEGIAITPDGKRAYVTNFGSDTVSVIDTSTNLVIATIVGPNGFGGIVPGGFMRPQSVAITPDGKRAYVTGSISDTVSVIDTISNTLETAGLPILVGSFPTGVAITPDGNFAYVANLFDNSVSVICTDPTSARCAYNTVVATITAGIGASPVAVATTPQGAEAYVTNAGSNTVSVICTDSTSVSCPFNTVVATVPVGVEPEGVAIKPF